MTIDLDALERIARDATLVTTGNGWIADSGGIVLDPDREGDVWDGTIVCEVPSTENAHRKWHLRDHIAAFDPPTALALIARVRELEAVVNDGGNQAAKYWTRLTAAEREMHARELHHFEEEKLRAEAEAERDRYREAIEAAIASEGRTLQLLTGRTPSRADSSQTWRILTRALNDKEAEK